MNNHPELPELPKGRKPDNEEDLNIIWAESDDVYKPILKSIHDFMVERAIKSISNARVYINANALTNLKTHLKSNLRVEQGGILFGNAYQDSNLGIYVDITAAIAAPATVGTGAHLDFTPSSWTGIMDYAKAQHPNDNIVGWYHSHPNLNAFMSGTDMNTQRAFFYHPWCLSIVYDPCREDMKFFLGREAQRTRPITYGNSLEEDHQYYPAHTNGEDPSIGWKDTTSQPSGSTRQRKGVNKILIFLGFWMIILLSGMLFIFFNQGNRFGQQPEPKQQTSSNIVTNNSQTNCQFKFFLRDISYSDFNTLLDEKYSNYLAFDVIKAEDEVGGGAMVTLLESKPITLPEQPIRSIKVRYEKVNLSKSSVNSITFHNDLALFDNTDRDLLIFQPNNLNQKNDILEDNISEFKKPEFIFFMYSYDYEENNKKKVENVIYIPKQVSINDGEFCEEILPLR